MLENVLGALVYFGASIGLEALILGALLGTFTRSPAAILFVALGVGFARTWIVASSALRFGDQWTDERWALNVIGFAIALAAVAFIFRWLHLRRVAREGRE